VDKIFVNNIQAMILDIAVMQVEFHPMLVGRGGKEE